MAILRGRAAPQKPLILAEDRFNEAAAEKRNPEDGVQDETGRNITAVQLVPKCTRLW
jgi:hypothetical protein